MQRSATSSGPAAPHADAAPAPGGRWLVVVNPTSGRGRADAAERAIREAARAEGVTIEVRRSQDGEDPIRFAAAAETDGFSAIVAAGGDGTAGAAARGLLEAKATIPLGIVPLGTGNGVARVLGVPFDPGRAFRALVHGRSLPFDVLDVVCRHEEAERHELALLFVGAGLDADLNRDADARAKKRFGFLAYVGATLANLRRLRPHQVRLTVDGRAYEVTAHTVTIFNGGRMTVAGVPVGPDADPHDGRADLAVLRATGFLQGLASVLRMATREGSRESFAPAVEARIEARPALAVHVDGGVVGTTPLTVRVLPSAMRVIAAPGYDPAPASSAATTPGPQETRPERA